MLLNKLDILLFKSKRMSLIVLLLLRGIHLFAQSDNVKTLLSEADNALKNNQENLSLTKANTAYELANTEGSAVGMGKPF
jgi:hypothetical protein